MVVLNYLPEQLGAVPAELGQLTKIETLNLSSNRIVTIPASLAKLKNLKLVNLRYCFFFAISSASIMKMYFD